MGTINSLLRIVCFFLVFFSFFAACINPEFDDREKMVVFGDSAAEGALADSPNISYEYMAQRVLEGTSEATGTTFENYFGNPRNFDADQVSAVWQEIFLANFVNRNKSYAAFFSNAMDYNPIFYSVNGANTQGFRNQVSIAIADEIFQESNKAFIGLIGNDICSPNLNDYTNTATSAANFATRFEVGLRRLIQAMRANHGSDITIYVVGTFKVADLINTTVETSSHNFFGNNKTCLQLREDNVDLSFRGRFLGDDINLNSRLLTTPFRDYCSVLFDPGTGNGARQTTFNNLKTAYDTQLRQLLQNLITEFSLAGKIHFFELPVISNLEDKLAVDCFHPLESAHREVSDDFLNKLRTGMTTP